jgi:type VI secretion system protein ImpG
VTFPHQPSVLDELLPFYERELSAIRALAAEFADQYPKVARRLQIAPDHCDDPDTERLFQTFAWVAARLGRRLDDPLPELAEPLLERLCPALTRPVPSCTILQLALDPREAAVAGRYRVPRHSLALAPPVAGTRCAFRTAHPVELWPVAVAGVRFSPAEPAPGEHGPGAPTLTLDLAALGGAAFRDLGLERLRFYLDGEPERAAQLYDLLGTGPVRVWAGPEPGDPVPLPAGSLRPAGFAPEEALFEGFPDACQGVRLLFEFGVFPEKFRFFDLTGLDRGALAQAGDRLRIRCQAPGAGARRRLEPLAALGPGHLRLGCVPAVNLRPQAGAPIPVDGPLTGARVRPAGRPGDGWDVHSIDGVRLVGVGPAGAGLGVPPWPEAGPESGSAGPGWVWRSRREPGAGPAGPGLELTLSLVDRDGQPARPEAGTLELQLTCSDGDRPGALPWAGGDSDREAFLLARHPLVAGARPRCRPSPRRPPPGAGGRPWPILASLFLNGLSLASLDRDRLQGLLDAWVPAGAVRPGPGLLDLATRPVTALLGPPGPVRFARGTEVAVTLGPDPGAGVGRALWARVLERFLAQACAGAGFVQVRLRGGPGEEDLLRPPRCRSATATTGPNRINSEHPEPDESIL